MNQQIGLFLLNCCTYKHKFMCCVGAQSVSHVQFCAILWTVARLAPLSLGLPRQECWSELPFPSPGDLPDLGNKSMSPALQANSLPLSQLGSPKVVPSILLLSLLMAEESVFILDIFSFAALLICVISLSQVLLKVYHSFSMTFWRISFLFQCFNLFSVLNVISLCSYLSRSFFLLNLGLFCPFSSF